MILEELAIKINSVTSGNSKKILKFQAHALNLDGHLGVGIENHFDKVIDEKFNNIYLKSVVVSISNITIPMLFLSVKSNEVSDKFIHLAYDFLSLKNRRTIIQDPFEWFYEWKELIGNSVKNKMIYDVIGELKTIEILQKNGENPVWASTDLGTYDIFSSGNTYEVKTTKSKTQNLVTIHSQFQLNYELIPNLYLVFCRVEKNSNGESIDSLAQKIILKGFNMQTLENYLEKIGYGVGKQERYEKYIFHEVRKYIVDESFPSIKASDFKGDKIPNNVIKFEYTISLDSLKYIDLLKES